MNSEILQNFKIFFRDIRNMEELLDVMLVPDSESQ